MNKSVETSANQPAKATKRRQSHKVADKQVEAQNTVNEEATATEAQTPEQVQEQPKKEYRKVVSVKFSFNRYYVFFKHVKPENNVGCGCKSAKSAMKYCRLLKARYNAYIPDEVYQYLKSESAKEA